MNKYVILQGNFAKFNSDVNSVTVVGLFDSAEQAEQWADSDVDNEDWAVFRVGKAWS